MKEPKKYDRVPLGLCDRLQGILPLAKKVGDEIASEERDILKELIPRMFKVMHKVAKLSNDYVKRCRWSPLGLVGANGSVDPHTRR